MTLLELKLETAIKEAKHGEIRLLREDAEAILELLREQNDAITALQCALDMANDKLAYISPDEDIPYYDCDAGRGQLNAWSKAIYEYTKEELKPKPTQWIKISPSNIYECKRCGQHVMTGNINAYKYCHGCGSKVDWSD